MRHAPRVRANSWEDVSDLVASFGLELDAWQEDVLLAGLGERSDGRWAVRQVGCSAPRQQGKTQLIVARVLAGLLLFDEEVIIVSAHRLDTSREVFLRLVALIEDNPSLQERVEFIGRSEMREYISMKSGQQVRFKARSHAVGRGWSCDCLLLDEAQILNDEMWAAILPTMSARPNPQVWLFGTPPTPLDNGVVFSRFRDAGLEGKDSHIAYLEWSAEPGDDLDDPATWAKANPAFGTRISHEAVAAERAAMTDEKFAMERLGMWSAGVQRSVVPSQSWADQADARSVATDRFALGVEVGPDLAWASIALAGARSDGDWHVELVEDQHTKGAGVEWLDDAVGQWVAANPQIRCVMVDVAGPVSALVEKRGQHWVFRGCGVRVMPIRVDELGSACALVLSGVVSGSLWHIGQPQLTTAVLSAGKRALGDTGKWVWSRRAASSDITPTQAVTYALAGAQLTDQTVPPSGPMWSSGGRRVVSM